MHCFPTGVRWLVRQIAGLLSKSGNIEPKEVRDQHLISASDMGYEVCTLKKDGKFC
jgi:hypothetical protein